MNVPISSKTKLIIGLVGWLWTALGCQQNTNQRNSSDLKADTVKLTIANATLAPDFQFHDEYILTENEAIYHHQKGENPNEISSKKMDKNFWEDIRSFSTKTSKEDPNQYLDGAEDRSIDFITKEKTYTFPASSLDEKANKILSLFDTEN